MFNAVMDDFTLQILVGEKLAMMIWKSNVIYMIILLAYVIWRIHRHYKGEPSCHGRHCAHLKKTRAPKKEVSHVSR